VHILSDSTRPKQGQLQRLASRLLLHVVVLVLSIIFILPFVWEISTSLKSEPQVFAMPPVWIPNPIVWRNYPDALAYVPFHKYVLNTLTIAVPGLVGILVSCTLAAYGFSRVRWKHRDFFFVVCLATMMIPFQVTMIPLFITYKTLGWTGTYLPLIVPTFFGNAYYIFLLRQFFLTIPADLSDAARVDGCSELGILAQVVLPLSRPVLAVIALFHFMWAWNDYIGPLIYIRNESQYTLALGLTKYQTWQATRSTWAWLMVASTVATVPIVILFFFTQRTFIEGITLTGIKG